MKIITTTFMKKFLCLAAMLGISAVSLMAQPAPSPAADTLQTRLKQNTDIQNPSHDPAATLTEFNLDFPGGTPSQLIEAIEKATGKPLNAIVNREDADILIPPLKVNRVTVPQLFSALEVASHKTGFGFRTRDSLSDNAIWYIFSIKPPEFPTNETTKVCQYYSLESYLYRGFTLDDITTAIQTGWKMMGATSAPELNYHKETKLLIACGEPAKLKTIDEVLRALPSSSLSVHTAKEYDNYIKDLESQVKELKEKMKAKPAAGTPAEKSGK